MFTFSVCLLWLILTQDQDVRTTHLQIEEMQRIINGQSAEIERLHEAETVEATRVSPYPDTMDDATDEECFVHKVPGCSVYIWEHLAELGYPSDCG